MLGQSLNVLLVGGQDGRRTSSVKGSILSPQSRGGRGSPCCALAGSVGAGHAGWWHTSRVPADHSAQVRAGKPLSTWVPLSHDPLLKPIMLPTLTPLHLVPLQFRGQPGYPLRAGNFCNPPIKCDQLWWGEDRSSQAPSGECLP